MVEWHPSKFRSHQKLGICMLYVHMYRDTVSDMNETC